LNNEAHVFGNRIVVGDSRWQS